MAANNNNKKELIMQHLGKCISHQSKWRKIHTLLFALFAAGTVICSTSASVLAALKVSEIAAILAGAATVMVSIDKSMMFRERYKHHLKTLTLLENIKVLFEVEQLSLEEASQKMKKIMEEYSSEMPLEARK
jgi:hypothetical protein